MNSKLYTGYEHIQQKKKIIIENILEEFGEQDQSILLLNYHTYKSMNFLKNLPLCTFYTNRTQSNFHIFLKIDEHKRRNNNPQEPFNRDAIRTHRLIKCFDVSRFGWTTLKGAWSWVRNWYAGSPYKHIIFRQSVAKAFFSSFLKRPEYLNIPALCFLPSKYKGTKIKSYRLITLFENMGIFLLTSRRQRCWNLFVQTCKHFERYKV